MNFYSAAFASDDRAEVVDGLTSQFTGGGESIDLAVAFVNSSDPTRAAELIPDIRESIQPDHFLACTAGGVIGGGHEIEDRAAVTLITGSLPNVSINPFHLSESDVRASLEDSSTFRAVVGVETPPAVFVLLAEPFSTPTRELLALFNDVYPGVPVVGGLASAGASPGMNVLALDQCVHTTGAVGLALAGDLEVEVIVSQGCKGIGPLITITESDRNVITSLGGEPPLKVLRGIFSQLAPETRRMVENGILMGIAAAGSGDDPGPGDFLIRNIAGADPSSGALAVTDLVEPGQLIRFFVRDAQSATDDFELMLSPQAFATPASAALLFSCNGRGQRLFNRPDGDVSVVARALGGDCPVAGFFCAGELGPIGSVNYIHGQTASLVLLKPSQN